MQPQGEVEAQMLGALISAVVSACVSVLVNGVTARSTERRTTFLAKKASICKDIEEISVKARAYWRTSGLNQSIEYEIMSLLDRLFFHVSDYFDHATSGERKEEINLLIENFHEVATGSDFATSGRTSNGKLADDIRDRAVMLTSRITDLKLNPKK